MSKNSQTHLCAGKCPRFDGEQCNTCLVSDDVCDFAVGDLVVPKSNTVNSVPAVREVIELDGDDKFLITIGGNHRQSWRFIDGWRTATLAEIAAGHRIDEPKTQVVMRADELEITPYICSICKDLTTPTQTEKSKLIPFQQVSLLEKYSRLKFNNQSLKVALAMSIVAGVVGWML